MNKASYFCQRVHVLRRISVRGFAFWVARGREGDLAGTIANPSSEMGSNMRTVAQKCAVTETRPESCNFKIPGNPNPREIILLKTTIIRIASTHFSVRAAKHERAWRAAVGCAQNIPNI